MLVTEDKKKNIIKEDEIEIRFSNILQFLKNSRWTVFRWTTVFAILGILYALSKQNEYTTTVTVMPELKTSGGAGGLGDLRSLAGLAGINLGTVGGSSEAIRPDLYPNIVQSVSFSLYLLKQPVSTETQQKAQTLQNYFTEKAKNSILGKISGLLGSDKGNALSEPVVANSPMLKLTRQQETLSKLINARVTAEMDKKSGIITITSQMPDANVSATVASKTLDYLTNYVTNYRTGKARQQLQFLTQQVKDARHRYEITELELSNYRDRNRNIYLNTAKIEEQRLQSDFLLAQAVYSDLSKQQEQARIKVQEESPVFQVLEPARVPIHKSGPNRTGILIGFTIFGALLGLVAFFASHFLQKQSK